MIRALAAILTRPHIVRHPVRTAAVLAGVALAVAAFSAMHLANASIATAFTAAADRLAGSAQLQITGGEGGVPEEALDAARAAACVEAAAPVIARLVTAAGTALTVVGVDLLEESQFREYTIDGHPALDDALVLLAQPDSVIATREFALRNHLAMGSGLPVWNGQRRQNLRIRGLVDSTGVMRAYGGNVLLMDIYAAQHIFSQRGVFDRIDLRVKSGAGVGRCAGEVKAAAGMHLNVEPPVSRGRETENFSATYLLLVESSGLAAALIAIFLVNQAASITVAQREREIGVVLGLGAEARSLKWLVAMESAGVGFAGGLIGTGLGTIMAKAVAPVAAALIENRPQMLAGMVVTPPGWGWLLTVAAASAVVCALAAVAPAWRAAGVPPIQLAEAARYADSTAEGRPVFAMACVALFPAAIAWQWVDRRPAALYLTLPAAAAGLAALARLLAPAAVAAARPLLNTLWGFEGRVAVDGLSTSVRRTQGAMVGIASTAAVAFAIANVTAGYAASYHRWVREVISADYMVLSGSNIVAQGQLFPISLGERLKLAPGAGALVPLRRLHGRAAGVPVKLVAADLSAWSANGGPAAPGAATISENLANLRNLKIGDSISIDSPAGPFTLEVRRIIPDHTSDLGMVCFDWPLYREKFRTEAVEMFLVYRNPGTANDLRAALAERMGADTPGMILDGAELRRQVDEVVGNWRSLSAVQGIAALMLALIASAGFLGVSVNARRGELGILAVLGWTPRQAVKSLAAEACALALCGIAIGVAIGLSLQAYLLATLRTSVNGFAVPWAVDFRTAAIIAAGLTGGALVAAVPAAARLWRANLALEIEADA